ncbi:MAG: helix-turn-helix transcriptional regulator [Muribaculaceae bacterium]|nr:helix-turn-helix transcriptional regulator [Muribaculaceae bacterium]
MLEITTFEAAAHYMRGVTTMFFIFWAIEIYKHRKEDNMKHVLFITISFITLCYLKDIIFIIDPIKQNIVTENIVGLIDMLCAPFVCAFFHEASAPGKITKRNLIYSVTPFALFIPIYLICKEQIVIQAAYIAIMIYALISLGLVCYNVMRYNKELTENYSYTQDISVGWVVKSGIAYFLWFAIYGLCFKETTWLGEIVFDIFSMLIWGILCYIGRKHHVIKIEGKDVRETLESEVRQEEDKEQSRDKEEEKEIKKESSGRDKDLVQERIAYISAALEKCIEKEKIYLNPKLSLNDLALAVGTNRSYISNYLNQRGKTFYDYINEYRVQEACRIIEAMTVKGKQTMNDVALQSGFNSISSFNRYFQKMVGISPKQYQQSKHLEYQEQ